MNWFGIFFCFILPGMLIGSLITAGAIAESSRRAAKKRRALNEANVEKMRALWKMRVGE